MSKKILVVCQHFWPESFRINDLCDGFRENSIEVDVLCGEPNYPKGEWFEGYGPFSKRHEVHNGIQIHRTFEIKRGKNTNLRIFLNYITFPIVSIFHVPALLSKKYDKVFIYSLSPVYMGIAGIMAGKIQKKEIITYVMDLWPENLYSVLNFRNSVIRKILMASSTWFYKKSDKLVCLSEKAVKILKERTGKPDECFCCIPQCCEKIYENNIYDESLNRRFGGSFNLVFTGNISPAQDFPLIIDAAQRLNELGFDINWIIVGDGMSKKETEKEISERGLSGIFFFEGFKPVEEIPKYTYIASGLVACLVQSSLLDCTIPAKVMSYIASGKPMILAMDGEAQNIVNNNNCGFASDSGDVEAFVNNIAKLYSMTEADRAAMGRNGKELHNRYFERNANLKKMLDFVFDKENFRK